MLAQLPESIKEQVIDYLRADNFPAAKRLHDEWLRLNHSTNQQTNGITETH